MEGGRNEDMEYGWNEREGDRNGGKYIGWALPGRGRAGKGRSGNE